MHKEPNIRSANDMLMTRNKLFLRRFLFIAKRTIVRKFPTATKTTSKAKTVQNAIPSALDESSSEDDEDVLLEPVVVDMFFSLVVETKR